MDAFDDEQLDDMLDQEDDAGDDEDAQDTFVAEEPVDEAEAQKAANATAEALLAQWRGEDVEEPKGIMGPQGDLSEMSEEQRAQVQDFNKYFGELAQRRADAQAEVDAVFAREAAEALERLSPAERAAHDSYEAIDYSTWDSQSILDLAASVETGVPMRRGQIVSEAEFAEAMSRAVWGDE